MEKNYFTELNSINVNDHTEKKGNLTYLSWAWAWGELKKRFPTATYTVYENDEGWCYHTDGRTAWVKTGVTVEGIEHIEYLPVMDSRNKSIPLGNVTSFDVNKAIQRSLTKAVARHGLGLYIYAGEDLPNDEAPAEPPRAQRADSVMTQKQVDSIVELVKETFSGRKSSRDAFKAVTGFTVQELATRKIPAKEFDSIISKLTLAPEDARKVIDEVEKNGRADS